MFRAALGKIATNFSKVVGNNVEAVVTVQQGKNEIKRQFDVPVRPRYTAKQIMRLVKFQNERQQDLGATESSFPAEYLAQEWEIKLQGFFAGGQQAMTELPEIMSGSEFVALVAGSGNGKGEAAAMADCMAPRDDIVKMSTTSGGWVQNVTRGMGDDQGSLNAAFIQGMVAKAAENPHNRVHSASFSQGSHAARDAQNAFTQDQMASLSQAEHTTMGGSSNLRVDHVALTSSFDPVPLAAHVDPFTPTASGRREEVQGDNWHNGLQYAKRFSTEILNQ